MKEIIYAKKHKETKKTEEGETRNRRGGRRYNKSKSGRLREEKRRNERRSERAMTQAGRNGERDETGVQRWQSDGWKVTEDDGGGAGETQRMKVEGGNDRKGLDVEK